MSSPTTKLDDHAAFAAWLFKEDNVSPEEAFMRLHDRLVKFFVWRNVADPEDLASEVTRRLLRNIAVGVVKLEGDKPWSYVYAIARNLFREHLRKKEALLVSLDANPLLRQLPEIVDLQAIELEEKLEVLYECINELRPSDREVIMTHYLGSKEDADKLATKFGLSKNSLWIRLSRIRQKLRKSMIRKMENK